MRFLNGLAVAVTAASLLGLVACGGSGRERSGADRAAASAQAVTSFAPTAAPASPEVRARVLAAAVQSYHLYSASQFAAFWNSLSAATKAQVPRQIFLGVHDGCSAAAAGKSRAIKAVTVFGNAAIVTATIGGALSRSETSEDVFNYADGRWSFSPADLSTYHHGTVAADIAAAKAAGFCTSWKLF